MGISITQLLILLAIVMVLFGTKKLRNMGTDLGEAIRGFKTALKEGEGEKTADADKVIEGETTKSDDKA